VLSLFASVRISVNVANSDIDQRIAAAQEAVMAETALMHREFGRARTEIKHDGTKVTAVDIAISQHLQAAIARQFPEDQFFSEELAPTGETTPVTSRFCWVCDPIDGTNNYASGISHCAISLALLEHGVPVYGVIYDLGRRRLIHGGPGRGVWDDGQAVHARREPPDRNALIGFHSPVEKIYAAEGRRVIENFKIRGLGSSTLHLAYCAVGLLNGVVEHNNKVWDIAAAAALVTESGAELFYLNEPPFPMREFTLKAARVQYVAGNAATVAKLREVLER
jgi:myo-inositol-1(or 4)-monophosphatase